MSFTQSLRPRSALLENPSDALKRKTEGGVRFSDVTDRAPCISTLEPPYLQSPAAMKAPQ